MPKKNSGRQGGCVWEKIPAAGQCFGFSAGKEGTLSEVRPACNQLTSKNNNNNNRPFGLCFSREIAEQLTSCFFPHSLCKLPSCPLPTLTSPRWKRMQSVSWAAETTRTSRGARPTRCCGPPPGGSEVERGDRLSSPTLALLCLPVYKEGQVSIPTLPNTSMS